MELIRQKEDMHFRMTESLDAKSQSMRNNRSTFENEVQILKEHVDVLDMSLKRTKE